MELEAEKYGGGAAEISKSFKTMKNIQFTTAKFGS